MTASRIPVIFFLVLIALAVIYYGLGAMATASVDLTWSHAAEKHGEVTAEAIRQICDNGGALRTYQQSKFRFIQICRIDERYGCRVLDLIDEKNWKWQEVTAFVKSCFDGKSLSDVDDYARKNYWTKTGVRIK